MASSIALAEIPTLSLLYRTKHLLPASKHVVSTPSSALNNTISHLSSDITKLRVDCIVNAANESLLGGGGVDGAIHRGAGPGLVEECRTLDGCDTGDAKITDAYELPCRKVIHTVGPVYFAEKVPGRAESLLQSCYSRSLNLAAKNGLRSIAFSSISTGVYGYPSTQAAKVAIRTVKDFLESNSSALDRVIFCTFEKKDEHAYRTLLPEYFPPTEQDNPQSATSFEQQSSKSEKPTSSPETLAASLPDPPTSDPVLEGQPDAKKQKLTSDSSDARTTQNVKDDDRSEDDWERVDQTEGTSGSIDDEPVEVENAPTAADVQSVVSSTADLDESGRSDADGK